MSSLISQIKKWESTNSSPQFVIGDCCNQVVKDEYGTIGLNKPATQGSKTILDNINNSGAIA